MDILFLLGRLLVGGALLYLASFHLLRTDDLAGYAASKGLPFPRLGVIGSGVLLFAGAASVITGVAPAFGVAALALFLVPVTLTMHAFWRITDAAARGDEALNFVKNVALLGATLAFLMVPQPWPLALG